MFKVLTGQSPKLVKGEKFNWLSAVLYMTPATFSGWNMCPMASAGCIATCLNTAGRGGMARRDATPLANGLPDNTVQAARLERTRRFMTDRAAFLADIAEDCRTLVRVARRRGMRAAFRFNGTSDVAAARLPIWSELRSEIEAEQLTVYDYTKVPTYLDKAPPWYHLALSRSERNASAVEAALASGNRVAVVFRSTPPKRWQGWPVVNGDEHDLIFLHRGPVVLGLKAKGRAKRDTTGFVVDLEASERVSP